MTLPAHVGTQLATIKRGIVNLYVEDDLAQRLAKSPKLTVKAGFDPTRPDLHLGHAVLLTKLRQFQDLGHEVAFVVGDFTAQIGDPSGRNATRPMLTREQIEAGARSYAEQAFKILNPGQTRVVYNSEWLKPMGFHDVIRLAGKYTLARMMERDDFKTRWQSQSSISLHELLYPLVQAYDSVALKCDVELGGTDQLFNLLVGRELMRDYDLQPQIVITTPILEGIQARSDAQGQLVGDKMSKSLNNAIGLTEDPSEQMGKIMSISDALMWRYYTLLSAHDEHWITEQRQACEHGEQNPKDLKLALASEIIARFHDKQEAERARESWQAQFSQREVPTDIPERTLVVATGESGLWLPKALAEAGLVKSSSEGRRRIQQGAVEVDGQKVSDVQAQLARGGKYLVKAGKRAWAYLLLS